jgi:ubiquinone biosynthesis accessory factor UbiJ
MIKALLTDILERLLTQLLSLDRDVAELLVPLSGKVIAVNFQPIDQTIFFCPTDQGIQLVGDYYGDVDTHIEGSVTTMALMTFNTTSMRSIFTGDLKISGDMAVGRNFQRFFKQLDPDFEERLSQYTGDIAAHQLGNVVRSSFRYKRDALKTLQLNMTEFLQDETQDTPSGPEVDVFFKQVDDLRSDFDRLVLRVNRLQGKVKEK